MVDVGKYTIHWVFGRAILPAHVECRYLGSWKPRFFSYPSFWEVPFKWLWWSMDMHVFSHNMCVVFNKYIYIYIYRLEKLKSSCFLVLVLFHTLPSDDESRILCESLCRFTAGSRSWPGVGRWRRDRHEQKPGELRLVFLSLTVRGVGIGSKKHVFFAELHYTII